MRRRSSAERLFARLLRLLPRCFVAEYGAEMAAHFAERAGEARGRGRARFVWFLLREISGLARAAVAERAGTFSRSARRPGSNHRRAAAVVHGNDGRAAHDHGGHRPHRKAIDPMMNLLNEARHAARRLARTPGFTVASIATLALAIGANTAIFTLLHRVVLSPLPYPAADRLVALEHTAPGVGIPSGLGMNVGLYREYASLPSLEALALYGTGSMSMSGNGEAERVRVLRATPSLGGIIGAHPVLGRWFAESEGEVGAPRAVILTHGFWQRRFGGSRDVLGTTVHLDGNAYEVIGVLSPDFAFTDDRAQAVVALRLNLATAPPSEFNYGGIARLRPGISVEALRREQDGVIAELPTRFPDYVATARMIAEEGKLASLARPYEEQVLGGTGRTLWVLLGAVAVVLVIAFANLANLFMVRAESRRREVAVRRALGAATGRVAVYFLAEALLVALISGALGLWIGYVAIEVLVLNGPVELPRLHEVRVDGVVVVFTALASFLAGIGFALVMLGRSVPALSSVLMDATRGTTVGRSRMRARHGLLAAQVALALVLLVGAGLMVRSFSRLLAVDPGFRADARLVFRIGLPLSEYPSRDAAAAFNESLLNRLAALPGVERAALTTRLPLDGQGWVDQVAVRDRPAEAGADRIRW